jgi:hypothetical protein
MGRGWGRPVPRGFWLWGRAVPTPVYRLTRWRRAQSITARSILLASWGNNAWLKRQGACAENFVFAERFEGGGGHCRDGDGIAEGVEDLNGIPFRAIRRNVLATSFTMSPRLSRWSGRSQVSAASLYSAKFISKWAV